MSHQAMHEQALYHRWPYVAMNLLTYPWKLWDMQYQLGMTIMDSVLRMSIAPGIPLNEQSKSETKPEKVLPGLEQLATARLRRGLAPPREVYEIPNRDRINWADFPTWARPTDPELFEGCSHEG